jgi:hypothetical protein
MYSPTECLALLEKEVIIPFASFYEVQDDKALPNSESPWEGYILTSDGIVVE